MTVPGGSGSRSRTHGPVCGSSLSAGNHVTMMNRAPPPRHELGASLDGQAQRSSLLTTGPEPACAHCLPPNLSLVLRPRESEPLVPTPAAPADGMPSPGPPPPAPHLDSSQRPLPHLPPGTRPSPQPRGLTSPTLPLEGQPPAGMALLPPPGVPTHRSPPQLHAHITHQDGREPGLFMLPPTPVHRPPDSPSHHVRWAGNLLTFSQASALTPV